jgi:hypothetical protein
VSSDHQRQLAIDRILSSVREAAESSLRSYATAVAESATDEMRRESTAELASLRDTVQRLEITRIDVESQLAEAHRLLDEARRASEQLVADACTARDSAIADERLRADAAIDDATRRAQAELTLHQSKMESRVGELAREVASAQAQAERSRSIIAALGSLDHAVSLGGVLGQLVEVAARMVPQAAVFTVKDDRLSRWRTIGFDAVLEQEGLAHLLDERSVVTSALRQHRLVTAPAPEGALASFSTATAAAPASAAVPVSVSGRAVAVLYVETPDADGVTLQSWCPALEVAARCAGRALELLTIRLAIRAGSSLVQPSHGEAPSSSGGLT